MSQIRVTIGFLDNENGRPVLRGLLDPHSLPALCYGDYQRGLLNPKVIDKMCRDLQKGASFPDMILGMRIGGHVTCCGDGFILEGDVYNVDGQQRAHAYSNLVAAGKSGNLHIGVKVFLETTEEWERSAFCDYNLNTHKLAPQILLFNWQYDYSSIGILVHLSTKDTQFALFNKVQWKQYKQKGELLSAVSLGKIIGSLHSHVGQTLWGQGPDGVARRLQNQLDKITEKDFRQNVFTFFHVVDKAFGIRNTPLSRPPAYMRPTFLACLARIFSDHVDFWSNNRLWVREELVTKLSKFPVNDAEVLRLAGAARSTSENLLYELLRRHMNKHKALTPRNATLIVTPRISEKQVKAHFDVLSQVNCSGGIANGSEIAAALHLKPDDVYEILRFFKKAGVIDHLLSSLDGNSHEWSIVQSKSGAIRDLLGLRKTFTEEFFTDHNNEPTTGVFQNFLIERIQILTN